MFCLKCGKRLPDYAKFCDACGAAVSNSLINAQSNECPGCGLVLDKSASICPYCGRKIEGRTPYDYIEKLSKRLEEEKSAREKIQIIKMFPLPDDKETLLEFMILACSSFDAKYYSTHLYMEDFSDAWLMKIEQCYQKTRNSFFNTSEYKNVEELYLETREKIAK